MKEIVRSTFFLSLTMMKYITMLGRKGYKDELGMIDYRGIKLLIIDKSLVNEQQRLTNKWQTNGQWIKTV